MNKNYINGRAKEYRICKKLKESGYSLVQRTAGSHSEVDILAINTKTKEIKLIQSKPRKMPKNQIKKILKRNKKLNGLFLVRFIVT